MFNAHLLVKVQGFIADGDPRGRRGTSASGEELGLKGPHRRRAQANKKNQSGSECACKSHPDSKPLRLQVQMTTG